MKLILKIAGVLALGGGTFFVLNHPDVPGLLVVILGYVNIQENRRIANLPRTKRIATHALILSSTIACAFAWSLIPHWLVAALVAMENVWIYSDNYWFQKGSSNPLQAMPEK